MYCQNVGGLRTKLFDLKLAMSCSNFDIIILCESWLTGDIADTEIIIEPYKIFRADRNQLTSSKSRGGGVIIAVKKEISAKIIRSGHDNVEHLFLLCKYGNEAPFIIGGVYIPPNSPIEMYLGHCQTVENIVQNFPSHRLILFGDYNLPDATWNNDNFGVTVNCPQGSAAVYLAQCFGFLHLFQLNLFPNSRNVFLDLLFSHDNSIKMSLAEDLLLPTCAHHYAYKFVIESFHSVDKCLSYEEFYYDFKNANYIGLNDYLASVDWRVYLNSMDVNRQTEKFYELIYMGIAMFVPLKKFKTSHFPKWFTAELRNLVVSKKIAHKNYIISKNDHDYFIFSQLRSSCKNLSKICYNNYIRNVDNNLSNNPKLFWKFLREQRSSFELPGEMYLNEFTTSKAEEVVDLFANFFSTVYSSERCDIPINTLSDHNLIVCDDVSLVDIFDKISKIPNKLIIGPDGIPNILLKMCVCTLSEPLHILFKRSLETGIFPELWKDSFIVPIYKSGDRSNIENYRSVCIQSSIPKMFDSLVYDQLFWYCRELIINQQHGFFRGRSTVTNLLVYETHLLNALENREQVDAIYTDFSKAFDKVNHNLLLHKLNNLGFNDLILTWLRSFLTGRRQRVKIGNNKSKEIEVLSGVPQGSHCAPLLFSLFVNDISLHINDCDFLLFADDLKLYRSINTREDQEFLQNDLNSLINWCKLNKLSLNINKCHHISFFKVNKKFITSYNIDGTVIKSVSSIRDLGVIFDEQMNFVEHITNISIKASKMLGFLLRNSNEFSVNSIKTVYCALVRSQIEYASIIWSPLYMVHVKTLERTQHKFLRFCSFKLNNPIINHDYTDILILLNLKTLEERRVHSDIIFIFKLINGFIVCPDLLNIINFNVPTRILRNQHTFNIQHHSTNYGRNSPIDRSLRAINDYNLNIFGCSLARFVSLVRSTI